ncbi:MAG TPA: SDR family oxidoreductase [Caulobacteraceae bacterium]|nr:SDR family oxidoreductase [Caulobacteraceae bacterium]
MRVFLTGASGFIGSAIIDELRGAGHEVVGLARSDESATRLAAWGVRAHRGELTDLDRLTQGARACDGVIHCAFIHDFTRFAENIEIDAHAVEAMTAVLEGSGKPFVLTSGTAMISADRPATEDDQAPPAGRGATEQIALDAAQRGVRASIMRLPQVHGQSDRGFAFGLISMLIDLARRTGVAAYPAEGANRWPAVHRLDAAWLYRLALEKAEPGTRLHCVAEEGVSLRAVSEVIAEGLGVPSKSLAADEVSDHFGWMAMFAGMDNRASSALTRQRFGWAPRQPDLLADMRRAGAFS